MDKEFFDSLGKKARGEHIPIVSSQAEELLLFMVQVSKAVRVLEIGTAVGYSTGLIASCSRVNQVTTIEIDEDRQKQAKENIAKAGLTDKVEFILGDAAEVLPALNGEYDFIFLDSAKGQYIRLLPECIRLLAPGGILFTDNVHFRGMVTGEEPVVKRFKTIVKRLQEYLAALNSHPLLETIVLPLGDGVAVSYKKGGN